MTNQLSFVNKPVNNHFYEWGRNSATLGHTNDVALQCLDSFGNFEQEDRDQFWMGFTDGPRESGEVISLPPIQAPLGQFTQI
jgi:hypothetical protein